MTYVVKFELELKTMGVKITHSDMQSLISDALWNITEFRNVQILSYEGDTEEDECDG